VEALQVSVVRPGVVEMVAVAHCVNAPEPPPEMIGAVWRLAVYDEVTQSEIMVTLIDWAFDGIFSGPPGNTPTAEPA
jgi:hypothetical protein